VLEGYVVYPIAALISAFVAWRAARSGLPAFHVIMRALFVVYLGWVVSATLFPLPVRAAVIRAEAVGQGFHVSLLPLASIRDIVSSGSLFAQLWLLGGNVLTLAPLGILLPFALPRLATWRRMAAVAFVVPLCIELAQLGVSLVVGYSYRVTEVDDLLLNFAGVLLGFAMYRVVAPRVTAA
jgi:glycopeptide antibiotics resistance protein